jgi:ribonuclease Z
LAKLTLTFLGTSAAAPTKARGLPAMVVQREGELVILDAGEGVQREFSVMGFGLNRETTILITHLHGDHVAGLPGLLWTMALAQRTKPLTIVAPAALKEWLAATAKILHLGLTFPLKFVPARRGRVIRLPAFDILAEKATHSIETFAYVIDERTRPGVFYPEKAKRLRVPEGKLWSRLQKGRSVVVKGRSVRPSQVTGPPRPGRRVGYSGDTRPSKNLARFFRRCDLLVFDSTYSAHDQDKAAEFKHSTSSEAAALAKKARVKKLALTHFSARYTSTATLVKEARRIFPNSFAASDGLSVEVDYPSV